MGLLDAFTGGSSSAATDAMKKAEDAYGNIQSPTQAQLTLPELQKYVQAGILTPAEAKTMLQNGNAYNDINLSPKTGEDQQDTLAKLKAVGDAKGMTPEMQAQLTQALDQVATNTHGTNASILDQMAQRGVPTSLMGGASMQAAAGDEARNANLSATTAAGQAEQNAINAMMNEGNLATTMHGQQYSEAADKAAAENAMKQWNAGATNTAAESNANRAQQAGAVNLSNAQDVSNQNTGVANQRTAYNANLPQQIYNNAITKAGGMSGAATNMSNLQQQQGKQNAGLMSGLLGTAGTVVGGIYGGPAGAAVGNQAGKMVSSDGTMSASEGAVVPGEPRVNGDSRENDRVHAMLSPGEIVLPRSVTTDPNAPSQAKNFVNHLLKNRPINPVHEEDIKSVLNALTARRSHAA